MAKATNTQFVELLRQVLAEKWGYVWGFDGELYSQALADKYAKAKRTPPSGRDPVNYWIKDCAKWIGRRAADCSGLIVCVMRLLGVFTATQDRSSSGFKDSFVKSGAISTIPDIPGLGVWLSGHIGVYIGNGEVIEARGTSYGVVKTKLKDRNFTHWGMFPGIDYDQTADSKPTLIYPRAAVCTGDGVRIRETPDSSITTNILTSVNKNHPLVVQGKDGDSWLTVATLNGDKAISGYIFAQYVSN